MAYVWEDARMTNVPEGFQCAWSLSRRDLQGCQGWPQHLRVLFLLNHIRTLPGHLHPFLALAWEWDGFAECFF